MIWPCCPVPAGEGEAAWRRKDCYRCGAGAVQRLGPAAAPSRILASPAALPGAATAGRRCGAAGRRLRRPGAAPRRRGNPLREQFLLCLPITKFTGKLGKGRRVIVRRFEGARFEITVREVVMDDRGQFWLAHRCTDPYLTQKVRLPENL